MVCTLPYARFDFMVSSYLFEDFGPLSLSSIFIASSDSYHELALMIEQAVQGRLVEISSRIRDKYGLSFELSSALSLGLSLSLRRLTLVGRDLFLSHLEHNLRSDPEHLSGCFSRWSSIRSQVMALDDNLLSVLHCQPEGQ